MPIIKSQESSPTRGYCCLFPRTFPTQVLPSSSRSSLKLQGWKLKARCGVKKSPFQRACMNLFLSSRAKKALKIHAFILALITQRNQGRTEIESPDGRIQNIKNSIYILETRRWQVFRIKMNSNYIRIKCISNPFAFCKIFC